jgi:RNA methyltransferase, TrmH family
MHEALGPRHAKVRELRALARDPRSRADAAATLVEGPRVIAAALDRDAPLTDAYLGYGARHAFGPLVGRLEAAGVPVTDLKEGVLEKIGSTRTPQPVLAVASWPMSTVADIVRAVTARPGGLFVVTVDVADPGNLGTIVRSAEAAGAAGVVVTGDGVDVRSPKVVRSSAGAVFGVPVFEMADAAAAVATLREYGVTCLGAVATGGQTPDALELDGAVAFVVGNEARGLNAPLLGALDGTVTIPMAGSAESLNVAMATTVLCFEAARQRAARGR